MFGIMNEPHDMPSAALWADTVQAVVTAIRGAGAISQTILLPGTSWSAAGAMLVDGSAVDLLAVRNPDGSTDGLVFDVHKYMDFDNSGTHAECVTNNIASDFAPFAAFLRRHGRRALLTEAGGGNVPSCVKYFCEMVAFLK